MRTMRRVIEILNAEHEGLDLGGGETIWYLVERDDHPEIKMPSTDLGGARTDDRTPKAGDCLGVKTKAQAVDLRRQALRERIPLDAL